MQSQTVETLLATAISSQNTARFEADLCAWLAASLSYDNITILAYFQGRTPMCLVSQGHLATVHARLDDTYLPGAYLLDPFHGLHLDQAPVGMYRMRDIAPDHFTRNQYYRDYYQKTTLIDEIVFVTYPSSRVSLHVCLGRDSYSGKIFSTHEIATARRIAPIVEVLSRGHWRSLTSDKGIAEYDTVPGLIALLKKRHDISLSPRQAEVALLVLRGHSSVSIGLKLGISPQTVKVFRKQLYKKCTISSQAELFNLMLPILGLTIA